MIEKPFNEFEIFKRIKDHFTKHDLGLLAQGKAPVWPTKHGTFEASNLFAVYHAFSKLGISSYSHLLDLGSGDGRVVFVAALFTKASGIDSDEHVHSKAIEHSTSLGIKPVFINKNFLEHNLSGYDVFFINPDKEFSQDVADKLLKEAKGKRLIVYNRVFSPDRHFKRTRTVFFDRLPVMEFIIE